MATDAQNLWKRYCDNYFADPDLGFSLDISRVKFADDYLDTMAPAMVKAMDAMEALERGAIANPDERRKDGAWWRRKRVRVLLGPVSLSDF